MLFRGGKVFTGEKFEEISVRTENGKIAEIAKELSEKEGEEVMELGEDLLVPGFIDLHTHGCVGYDFSTAGKDEIDKMCEFYLSKGITSVAGTTMTMGYEDYKKAAATIGEYMDSVENHNLIGINMEGPFLSVEKKGAHDPQYIVDASQEAMDELNKLAKGHFLIVDIAPDRPGAIEFIKKNSKDYVISVAHTPANYEKAMEAFEAGATEVTHLFNAMNGLGHRDPGVPGAAFEAGANVEMICDGIHIHPTVMKMVYKMFKERLLVISDSMSAAGLQDGEYVLGGLPVFVKDGKATLENGTIAGSTTDMLAEMGVWMDTCGLSMEEILPCMTINQAKAVHKENQIGSIETRKAADLVVISPKREIRAVYKNGVRKV
ncbi:MAG: N-acetylglucosamine-6-phosphate deacetylase [Lachnospiraceae bacterium]|nr:N-acetylglucosamine-6-phosphate deacetylase [Lachnospiraceae bacterium]